MRYLPWIAALCMVFLSGCSGMGDGEDGWEVIDIDGETEIWVPADPTPEQVARSVDRRSTAPRAAPSTTATRPSAAPRPTVPASRPTTTIPRSSSYPPPPPPPSWIPEAPSPGARSLPPPPPPPPPLR